MPDEEVEQALEVYPRPGSGASSVTPDDVTGPSPYRLYRAIAEDLWVLCPRESGQPCPRHGVAADHRARVFPA